ncbi:hypothetical protein Pla52n_31330 [Stieleria varia]|uniref:Uncharacterized protein n=1 Tax=Stieleria varia TaxID=2528005 RepID=A0A5C6AZZ3_9BACT|nr:hypothetical protein Pla52n_31330 [Stieleria varia]
MKNVAENDSSRAVPAGNLLPVIFYQIVIDQLNRLTFVMNTTVLEEKVTGWMPSKNAFINGIRSGLIQPDDQCLSW